MTRPRKYRYDAPAFPAYVYNQKMHKWPAFSSVAFDVDVGKYRIGGRMKIGGAPDCCTGLTIAAPHVFAVKSVPDRKDHDDYFHFRVADGHAKRKPKDKFNLAHVYPHMEDWSLQKARGYAFHSMAHAMLSYMYGSGRFNIMGIDRADGETNQWMTKIMQAAEDVPHVQMWRPMTGLFKGNIDNMVPGLASKAHVRQARVTYTLSTTQSGSTSASGASAARLHVLHGNLVQLQGAARMPEKDIPQYQQMQKWACSKAHLYRLPMNSWAHF